MSKAEEQAWQALAFTLWGRTGRAFHITERTIMTPSSYRRIGGCQWIERFVSDTDGNDYQSVQEYEQQERARQEQNA